MRLLAFRKRLKELRKKGDIRKYEFELQENATISWSKICVE